MEEKIGEFLIRTGRLSEFQAGFILKKQLEMPEKLYGEIGIEMGLIKAEDIKAFLEARALK